MLFGVKGFFMGVGGIFVGPCKNELMKKISPLTGFCEEAIHATNINIYIMCRYTSKQAKF